MHSPGGETRRHRQGATELFEGRVFFAFCAILAGGAHTGTRPEAGFLSQRKWKQWSGPEGTTGCPRGPPRWDPAAASADGEGKENMDEPILQTRLLQLSLNLGASEDSRIENGARSGTHALPCSSSFPPISLASGPASIHRHPAINPFIPSYFVQGPARQAPLVDAVMRLLYVMTPTSLSVRSSSSFALSCTRTVPRAFAWQGKQLERGVGHGGFQSVSGP